MPTRSAASAKRRALPVVARAARLGRCCARWLLRAPFSRCAPLAAGRRQSHPPHPPTAPPAARAGGAPRGAHGADPRTQPRAAIRDDARGRVCRVCDVPVDEWRAERAQRLLRAQVRFVCVSGGWVWVCAGGREGELNVPGVFYALRCVACVFVQGLVGCPCPHAPLLRALAHVQARIHTLEPHHLAPPPPASLTCPS